MERKLESLWFALMIIIAVLSFQSCSTPTGKNDVIDNYELDTLVRVSSSEIVDSIDNYIATIIDKAQDRLPEDTKSRLLEFETRMESISDSIRAAYGLSKTKRYRFEINSTQRRIILYDNGTQVDIYRYDLIQPLGGARQYRISDIESFTFYGDLDSIQHEIKGFRINRYY